jgi:hypothetical protein
MQYRFPPNRALLNQQNRATLKGTGCEHVAQTNFCLGLAPPLSAGAASTAGIVGNSCGAGHAGQLEAQLN